MNICLQNAIKNLSKKEDGECDSDDDVHKKIMDNDEDSFDESSGDEIN